MVSLVWGRGGGGGGEERGGERIGITKQASIFTRDRESVLIKASHLSRTSRPLKVGLTLGAEEIGA